VAQLSRPIVYLVTDRRLLSPEARTDRDSVRALEHFLDEAIDAGVDVVQIRERDLDAGPLRDLTRAIERRAQGSPTRVVVNDRADVARVAGAGGVHLRADGPPVARVRALGPAAWIVGRSTHSLAEARAHADADYLLFGTVFPSASKPAGAPVAGLGALSEVAAAVARPVIAIGGIDPARARACAAAGAAGVAGIGVFLPEGRAPGSLGPARAAVALRAAFMTH